MIAADTSSLIALLQGETGPDVTQLETELANHALVLPPVVLTEFLSRPANDQSAHNAIALLSVLDVLPGYWERAAWLRRTVLSRGLKSFMADALIAQSCIDHDVALITRDQDFRHYAKAGGLKLAALSSRS